MKTMLKYVMLTLVSLVLYGFAAEYALRERGYSAVGGEVIILFLPLFYYLVSKFVKEFIEEVKND